ncbi:hypothetical protein [Aliiroseovarius sp. F20344]|uniref:hypothetical protein n=1 Tax=Aliiroseovarius sp. F20344 TaxID=2926414 RepID=UPI001FF6F6ED|nr:hypothetical protein [Aliiroseovarius sp. F20344]MCK0142539.1 hypothetical protein [Aliiroseovarius sp. F20344]
MTGNKSVAKQSGEKSKTLGVTMSGSRDKGYKVDLAHKDALKEVFGSENPEMSEALLSHCLKVLKGDEASDEFPANDERGFLLATVAEIKPRDAFEQMLSVQMAATHVAMIRSGRWLANAERLDQVQSHYNGYTRLARAYVGQMEAFRKHRNGGKQTVTVQHVNVQDGGQAIVGNVSDRGRGANEK